MSSSTERLVKRRLTACLSFLSMCDLKKFVKNCTNDFLKNACIVIIEEKKKANLF